MGRRRSSRIKKKLEQIGEHQSGKLVPYKAAETRKTGNRLDGVQGGKNRGYLLPMRTGEHSGRNEDHRRQRRRGRGEIVTERLRVGGKVSDFTTS